MAYPLAVTLLFLISPVLSLAFILHGLFTSKRFAMWFGMLLALAIGTFVYTLIPDSEMDIYRYYERLDSLSLYSSGNALKEIWNSYDPITYTLMYFISQLTNKNFVPIVFSLISYSLLFYVILDYRKTILKSYDWRTSFVLFFVISTIIVFNTLTGLRFSFALSFLVLALYLDLIKHNRKIAIIFYALSPLLHSSMILMVFLRIGASIPRRSLVLIFYIVIGILASATPLLIGFSSELSQLPFLSHLEDRAGSYLSPKVPPGFLYPFSILSSVLMLVVIWFTRDKGKPSSMLTRINIATIIISLVNIGQFVIAFRFATIAKYVFYLVLLEILKKRFASTIIQKHVLSYVIVFGLISFIIIGSLLYQVIAFTGVNAQFTWRYPEVFLQNLFQILSGG